MATFSTKESFSYGVHSEVGQLRKVMVCAPGLAHTRLTPTNCDGLLFDDVLWVENAKRDHFDFITKMRDRGVEVVEMHDLLAETLDLRRRDLEPAILAGAARGNDPRGFDLQIPPGLCRQGQHLVG
jgi:arginine deiminase